MLISAFNMVMAANAQYIQSCRVIAAQNKMPPITKNRDRGVPVKLRRCGAVVAGPLNILSGLGTLGCKVRSSVSCQLATILVSQT